MKFILVALLWGNIGTRAVADSLNAVSPGASGHWSFYAASASETNVRNYLPITPSIDATNTVRVMGETSEPYRPRMEWEYGYAAGLVSVRPESDRNIPSKKGDLIIFWQAPGQGRYEVKVTVDNVGTDVQGGDGGTLTLSRLRAGESNDTNILDRIAVPASGSQSPHVQRTIAVEASAGDRLLLRLNAGIDGFGDGWQMRYVIARIDTQTGIPSR